MRKELVTKSVWQTYQDNKEHGAWRSKIENTKQIKRLPQVEQTKA